MQSDAHLEQMFTGARNFNQDISDWDTSNIKNMRKMFLAQLHLTMEE